MPLVLKTLKTFFRAKTRNRYYRIHTSMAPCPPDTHTPPLRYACGSSGSRAAPPPPRPCQSLGRVTHLPFTIYPPAELPIPPHPHPPADPPPPPQPPPPSFGRWLGGGVSHQDRL